MHRKARTLIGASCLAPLWILPAGEAAAQETAATEGDIIITADGQSVDRVSTLQRIVRNHAPGENIDIDVMRYGQRKSFRVKLGELEEPARSAAAAPVSPTSNSGSVNPTLGVSVQPVPAELAAQAKLTPAQRGVMVTDVVPLGPRTRSSERET